MLVREMAAYALGRLKDSSAIQPLIDALHSKEENNEFVLRQVTSALIEIGYLSIHYLIAALKENNDRQL
jgi:HEAT repeat protein